jgi:hypothetical protein
MSFKKFAFYLPQFHPCKANDDFWCIGFTDWVTTRNSTPLFKGHNQPAVPTTLGEYDLSNKHAIIEQAKLAKASGLDGFAIYHYYFDCNETALETPIEIIYNNQEIDIEYFVSWVNCDWTKSWIGDNDTIIRTQKYSLELFHELAAQACRFFTDERYSKIDGKPIYYIHNPKDFDVEIFQKIVSSLARKFGIDDIIWIAPECHVLDSQRKLFSYLVGYPPGDHIQIWTRFKSFMKNSIVSAFPDLATNPLVHKYLRSRDYRSYVKSYLGFLKKKMASNDVYIPCIIHSWDNSPRYGFTSFYFKNALPVHNYELYKETFKLANQHNSPFILIKAWNEWAEGNTLEPDKQFGSQRLKALDMASKDFGRRAV